MMGRLRMRLARVGAASVLGFALLGVSAGSTLAAPGWLTEMYGDAVVPGPGDADGFGIAVLNSVDPAGGTLCWTVSVEGLDELTALQIFHGAFDEAGTLVYDLSLTQDDNGLYADCWGGQDQANLQDIADNPLDYFVQVSTLEYEQGAIRGQLEGAEVIFEFNVGTMLCPEGIDTPEEAGAAAPGEGCAATYPLGAPPDQVPGHRWLVEPIGSDLDVRVLPDGWTERIVTDARFFFGNGTCDPVALACTSTGWFEWLSIPAGDVQVWQEVVPEGFDFGWTQVSVDGDLEPTIGASPTVELQLAGDEGVANVWFFDLVAAVAATPGPTLSITPPPTLSITPPPTATNAAGGSAAGPSALIVALLFAASAGVAAAAVLRRGNRDRG